MSKLLSILSRWRVHCLPHSFCLPDKPKYKILGRVSKNRGPAVQSIICVTKSFYHMTSLYLVDNVMP